MPKQSEPRDFTDEFPDSWWDQVAPPYDPDLAWFLKEARQWLHNEPCLAEEVPAENMDS